jgi:hypothetical protein
MSAEDIERATGRLMIDRRDSKQKVALLCNEITRDAKNHRDLADILDEITGFMAVLGTPGMKCVSSEDRLKNVARELPSTEELLSKCADLKAEMSRYRDLELRAKDF